MDPIKPVLFLAFANDRDDRARYLRNLAEAALMRDKPHAIHVNARRCN